MTELFNSTMNKSNPKDIKCKNQITLNLILLNKKAVGFIEKLNGYIGMFKIILKETIYANLFELSIKSECTIRELFNYSYMLGKLLNILVIGNIDKPDLKQLEKMLNFAIEINVPYYPRYLIKTNMITREDFGKIKEKLETINGKQVKFEWGNSQTQRYNFIESHISFYSDIIDFGCGEGFYVKGLVPKLSNTNKYIAWDSDPEELAKVKYFKEKYPEYNNLIIPESSSDLFDNIIKNIGPKPTIILSEVFEHIEPNQAIELVNKIKSYIDFGSIIITTPDVGFNVHLSSNGEINLRHPDHVHEYTQEEFANTINNIFGSNYKKIFYQIGDQVDLNSMTQSFIITPN